MGIWKTRLIRFGIEVGIIFTLFMIGLSFSSVEFTGLLVFALFFIAVIIAGQIEGHRRGLFHQGHFPMLFGVTAVIFGAVMFSGSLEWTNSDGTPKDKWWDFNPIEAGIFLFIIIIGILSFITGAKQSLQNQYFWGNIARRGR